MLNLIQKIVKEWIQYSIKDKLETVALCVAIVGAFITYNEYKTQHDLSITSQLRESDRHINSMILEYPVMDGIWMTVDENLHGKNRADALIVSLIKNKSPEVIAKMSKWHDIGEFETILWSQDNFYNEEYLRLRQVYMLAEEILYLVAEVLDLEEDGRLSPTEVNTYTAYIRDLGSHPLFLHAIWFGHKSGYFTPYVAKRLQQEILKNEEAKIMVGEIYKGLKFPDWPKELPK